ncbi:MAG: iron complex outermembrane receptor protein [Bacteroidia bacterium]|jgi:iron complex outermembrane receptor protein
MPLPFLLIATIVGGVLLCPTAHSAEKLLTEDVLVTASRVAEESRSLALTWTVVDEKALAIVGPVHINEIMQQVPGAWISRGNGQESLISLRSPVLTGPGSCGAFLTASDGISLRAPGFCNVNQLFDANAEQAGRIEVIKGPATALYGSNAMHGVINILSAPPTDQADHGLALEAGPDDYYRAKYHYRATEGAHGISLNANGVSDGGYKDDAGFDQQKLTLRHDYQGSEWQLRTVLDASNLNQETAGFIQGFEVYKDDDLKNSNPNPEAYRDARSLRLYSRASRELDSNTTLIITPYLRSNEMEFLQHFLPWQPVEENEHDSLGIRASIHTLVDDVSWIIGLDTEYTDGTLKEVQADGFSANQPAGVHYDYQVDASVLAGFTQWRTQYDSPWEFTGGLRFEHTNYDYDNRTEDGTPCGPEASNCRFFRPADREDSFSDWSLNLGASYQWADHQITYLRIAQGFRAPQTTELYRLQSGQSVAELESEEIDNIELGLRGRYNNGASYDLALFYMEKDEVIFQDSNRQNVSGAKTEHYGAELGIRLPLSETVSLGIDATFASHTYADPIALLGASGNIKGNDIDTSPNAFGSARLDWDLSGITGRMSHAQLEWVYLDEYYLEPDNEHQYDGHSLLNLRLSGNLTSRLACSLRVTNLLDEDYAERADFGFGNYRYFVGQDRGAYFEVSYQFGDTLN